MKQFYLKQKVLSVRDSYTIYDEKDQPVYTGKARMFTIGKKIDMYAADTEDIIYTLNRKLFSFLPAYTLNDKEGREIAKMKQQFSMRNKKIDIEGVHGEFHVKGSLWAFDFEFYKADKKVVDVNKKRLSWGDTYEITIHEDENAEFYLALVLMIDCMFHSRKSSRRSIR